jgi:hypothetical protein
VSVAISDEKRMLTATEFDAVSKTHYPAISDLSRDELAQLLRLLRDYRDKARDTSRQQRREMRGKAEARGARPARDNTGTKIKASIFASALKRLNRELRRLEQAERRTDQVEIARRALEMKRAARVRHHPSAGRTASEGMRPSTNPKRTVDADPREVGRVSQTVKAGQARRDSKGG